MEINRTLGSLYAAITVSFKVFFLLEIGTEIWLFSPIQTRERQYG